MRSLVDLYFGLTVAIAFAGGLPQESFQKLGGWAALEREWTYPASSYRQCKALALPDSDVDRWEDDRLASDAGRSAIVHIAAGRALERLVAMGGDSLFVKLFDYNSTTWASRDSHDLEGLNSWTSDAFATRVATRHPYRETELRNHRGNITLRIRYVREPPEANLYAGIQLQTIRRLRPFYEVYETHGETQLWLGPDPGDPGFQGYPPARTLEDYRRTGDCSWGGFDEGGTYSSPPPNPSGFSLLPLPVRHSGWSFYLGAADYDYDPPWEDRLFVPVSSHDNAAIIGQCVQRESAQRKTLFAPPRSSDSEHVKVRIYDGVVAYREEFTFVVEIYPEIFNRAAMRIPSESAGQGRWAGSPEEAVTFVILHEIQHAVAYISQNSQYPFGSESMRLRPVGDTESDAWEYASSAVRLEARGINVSVDVNSDVATVHLDGSAWNSQRFRTRRLNNSSARLAVPPAEHSILVTFADHATPAYNELPDDIALMQEGVNAQGQRTLELSPRAGRSYHIFSDEDGVHIREY